MGQHSTDGTWPAALSDEQAMALADNADTAALAERAAALRDRAFGNTITYSPKVFIPLTQLCRDVCHYCTFAQTPRNLGKIYLSPQEVIDLCQQGASQGCHEALFTLGEKPELRYRAAREALAELGFESTLAYVAHVAERVLKETGLLPHINAGCMDAQEVAQLRRVSASMGIMLESASSRLCEKGMPHYGSPDKDPAVRLETIALAGAAAVPFTSGILIGIGETRAERIESLLALRSEHQVHGHLQEVIIQNFRAKAGTKMAEAPEPDLDDLLWTIAVARLIFGPEVSIQAPPNLSPGVLPQLVAAGINDWGGVSPVTPDHVNPEAPWPHLQQLADETARAGKGLEQRLTIYPRFIQAAETWLAPEVVPAVLRASDSEGLARGDLWIAGQSQDVPAPLSALKGAAVSTEVAAVIALCESGQRPNAQQVATLFSARGKDFDAVIAAADKVRSQRCGDTVSYVVNRNINYTNVCYYNCRFCAFSKGRASDDLRGKPYDISGDEIARRCTEAWQRGATEVCMQGGIHPDYTGKTYLTILETVRAAVPDMHIHAFSPLEVWQGAETLGLDLSTYLGRLREAGLNTLPGTAAEVLHDDVRATLCADKLNSAQWLEVMEAAHGQGFKTTATIMFGHIDGPEHWAEHLLAVRDLQARTGGFTEFVPLPYVADEAPLYRRGQSRRGPSFREAVLMHAVARLVFNGLIDNIQVSWVKMGREGAAYCLRAGANDLGGSLMNESITRAAGASHGQEWSPFTMVDYISAIGRTPRMRNTLYGDVSPERERLAHRPSQLLPIVNAPAGKTQSNKRPLQLAAAEQTQQPRQHPASQSRAAPPQQVVMLAACN